MRVTIAPLLTLFLAMTACSQFPQLDETVNSSARNAAYPDLIPVEDIYARMPDTQIEPATTEDVETRVARLKSRAARLRGTVIDGATRSRMKAGVN